MKRFLITGIVVVSSILLLTLGLLAYSGYNLEIQNIDNSYGMDEENFVLLDNLSNPRHRWFNDTTGNEVWGFDHDGSGTMTGNLTLDDTYTQGGGWVIADYLRVLVKGWIKNLQVDEQINASDINATTDICVTGGNCLTDSIQSGGEQDPHWTGNFSDYNASWTTTEAEIWDVAGNGTLLDWGNAVNGTLALNSSLSVYARWSEVGNGTMALNSSLEDYTRWGEILNGTIDSRTTTTPFKLIDFDGTATAGQIPYTLDSNSVATTNFLFWDNTNVRMGIGTNSPSASLDVSGNAYIKTNLTADGNLTINTNTLFVNSDSSYVGIGTNTPRNLFNVVGVANITSNLTVGDYLRVNQDDNRFLYGDSNINVSIIGNQTQDGVFSIIHKGLITKDRPTLFVWYEQGYASAFRRSKDNAGNALFLFQKSRGTIQNPTATQAGDNIFQMRGEAYNGTDYNPLGWIRVKQDSAWSGGEASGDLIFAVAEEDGTLTERFFINGSQGNVGLGTSTPQNTLNVVGDFNVTGTSYIENDCGVQGTLITFERGNVASSQYLSFGNGQTPTGAPQVCSGVVTAISGAVSGAADASNHVAIELTINGVSQTCDTDEIDDLNTAHSTTGCDVSFSAGDLVGCKTKTETGTVTELVCSLWLRYD